MRPAFHLVPVAACALIVGTASAAATDDRVDGSDHFTVKYKREKVKGQIYAWATRDGKTKATSVASLSINPSISNKLTVRVSERAVVKAKLGTRETRKYTEWQVGRIELRAGSYGQSAPAFTYDVGSKKGWVLCAIQVRGSLLQSGFGAGTPIASFQMSFSSPGRC